MSEYEIHPDELAELKAERAELEIKMAQFASVLDRIEAENKQLKTEVERLTAERDELLERCIATRQTYGIKVRDRFGLIEAALAGKEEK